MLPNRNLDVARTPQFARDGVTWEMLVSLLCPPAIQSSNHMGLELKRDSMPVRLVPPGLSSSVNEPTEIHSWSTTQ